mgnify:FL=1
MILNVLLDGDTHAIEVDTAALSWAERCTGVSAPDIGEASLQLAAAYYYLQHQQSPNPVDWDLIHRWGTAHHVITSA